MNNRTLATAVIWIGVAIAMVALFVSAAVTGGMTSGHVLLGIISMIGASSATGAVWGQSDELIINVGNDSVQAKEKSKRRSIEDALRNLSDADLENLRDRLRDDNIDDELLMAYLADTDEVQEGRR